MLPWLIGGVVVAGVLLKASLDESSRQGRLRRAEKKTHRAHRKARKKAVRAACGTLEAQPGQIEARRQALRSIPDGSDVLSVPERLKIQQCLASLDLQERQLRQKLARYHAEDL